MAVLRGGPTINLFIEEYDSAVCFSHLSSFRLRFDELTSISQ